MQFEGLRELLKKKKLSASSAVEPPAEGTAQPPASVTPSVAGPLPGSKTVVSATDPYAAALQKVSQLQNQQQERCLISSACNSAHDSRKRTRESPVVADDDQADGGSKSKVDPADVAPSVTQSASTDAINTGLSTKALKTEGDIRAAQQHGVIALRTCRTKLEHFWAGAQYGTDATPVAPAGGHPAVSPLPVSVGKYLITQFVSDKRVSMATGEPEMALLDREFELLSALRSEMMPDDARQADGATATSEEESEATQEASADRQCAVDVELLKIGETVRVLWYLIALRWEYSLDPHQFTVSKCGSPRVATVPFASGLPPNQQGWSPYVYLALQGALPPDVRLLSGREVAQEVDQWRSRTRTRQFALELLAYLHSDYMTMKSAPMSATAVATPKECIVPFDLRDSLHAMLVQHLQHDRNYLAVRQDYVDMTMGTANWKLGLFSGGEVHMRRSMERVERNRIHHLLNNEHAAHLLQSVREVTSFVEQQQPQLIEPFFVPRQR
ncbi:hypothetical protein ABL78_3143 [Leptomonas seymouri]|uniref:Pre-mRNA-splicing factor 18 n=1 Tax=Leptomonas seymouri TaxID=5684 RepID=A0A0N1I883_LEPSE|nr:hypothetical protein ABL78_3143 [Leptomonas seymouri]|eukprot:KPI87785.1 hypothetical protein ABL78_3143 [Leptomonas seymouri]